MYYLIRKNLYLLIFLTICSCYPRVGKYYTVRKGDTLSSIARKYNLAAAELSRVNRIKNSSLIIPGERIYIPYRKYSRKRYYVKKIIKEHKEKKRYTNNVKNNIRKKRSRQKSKQTIFFTMPARGRIIKKYGFNGLKLNKGIDILVENDGFIRASESGKVIYEGEMEYYKKVIIISHNEEFATVYSNNEENLVKLNQKVKKGEIIASANKQDNILHFEVRKDGKAIDPEEYIKR